MIYTLVVTTSSEHNAFLKKLYPSTYFWCSTFSFRESVYTGKLAQKALHNCSVNQKPVDGRLESDRPVNSTQEE